MGSAGEHDNASPVDICAARDGDELHVHPRVVRADHRMLVTHHLAAHRSAQVPLSTSLHLLLQQAIHANTRNWNCARFGRCDYIAFLYKLKWRLIFVL